MRFFCASLFLLMCMGGCNSSQNTRVTDDIGYSKVSYFREEDDKDLGAHSIGFLKMDTPVDGQIYKGWLHLLDNGVVCGGTLAKDTVIHDLTIPTDTWISFNRDGTLGKCNFPRDVNVQGFACIGTGGGTNGAEVGFHGNGKLAEFLAPQNVTIQGVPCKGGLFNKITLHERGRLKSCTLSEMFLVDGQSFSKNSIIEFDPEGIIIIPKQ